MRWHRLVVLLVLAGCGGGGPACPPLRGCVSALVIQLPASVQTAEACVNGVCASEISASRELLVPIGRREDGDSATVSVTVDGAATPVTGVVPLARTRPDGPSCPTVCVNGTARLDVTGERIVPVPQ